MGNVITENIDRELPTLVEEIERGEIKLPKFQRGFVWKEIDVAKFFDSVVKRLPFGNITLWESSLKMKSFKLIANSGNKEGSDLNKSLYALDGQQRLTSIYGVFKGITYNKVDFKNIFIDVTKEPGNWEEESVVITKKEIGKRDGVWIPLFEVLNNTSEVTKGYKLTDKEISNAYGFSHFMKQYKVPIDKTSGAEMISVAIDIFTRLNKSGKPLSEFDIISAIVYDEELGFDLEEKTKDLKKIMKKANYILKDNKSVIQLVSALTKGKISPIYKGVDMKDDYINNWKEIVKAVEKAIDLLVGHFKINKSSDLPSIIYLHTFSYFYFKNKKNATTRQLVLLEEYFWKTSLSGRYEYTSTPKAQSDLARMDLIIKGIRPQYSYNIPDVDNAIIKAQFSRVGSSNAFGRAIVSAMWLNNPMTFSNGDRVSSKSISNTNELNKHHLFPKSLYKGDESGNIANNIFNISLLDAQTNKEINNKTPKAYMYNYKEKHDNEFFGEFSEILSSHFIKNLDDFGITENSIELLINMRAKLILDFIKDRYSSLDKDENKLLVSNK